MVAIVSGRLDWGEQISPEGQRDYGITWLVRCTHPNDGPSTVMLCPDLPQVGSVWDFGNESDPWAFCRPDWTIDCLTKGEPGIYWTVSQTFSTRPRIRCHDFQIDDPLLEPYQISGSFNTQTKEVRKNRNGRVPTTSSWELIRGPIMEFDHSKHRVSISLNSLTLGIETFTSFQDRVNDSVLWGFEPRCVKLSNTTWQRKVYGVCGFYYTKTHDFDIDPETFDRKYPDIGTRVLVGWSPGSPWKDHPIDPEAADPSFGGLPAWLNPANYECYFDINGNIIEEIPLDGMGRPITGGDEPAEGTIEYYEEANFLELGIPLFLE